MVGSLEILCLGDVILDTYCEGLVERISPEAPIPILKVQSNRKKDLGGSGNVARNITAAGSKCHLISIVGNDNNAKLLKELCKKPNYLSFEFIVDKRVLSDITKDPIVLKSLGNKNSKFVYSQE